MRSQLAKKAESLLSNLVVISLITDNKDFGRKNIPIVELDRQCISQLNIKHVTSE